MTTMERLEHAWAEWLRLVRQRHACRRQGTRFHDERRLNAQRDLVADLSEQVLLERQRKEQQRSP